MEHRSVPVLSFNFRNKDINRSEPAAASMIYQSVASATPEDKTNGEIKKRIQRSNSQQPLLTLWPMAFIDYPQKLCPPRAALLALSLTPSLSLTHSIDVYTEVSAISRDVWFATSVEITRSLSLSVVECLVPYQKIENNRCE